jgi:ankyrin repeat protein
MAAEDMPGLERPYNHRLSLCHLGEDADGDPYRVLTKLVSTPAFSEYIEVEGESKRVFREEHEDVECTITEGENVWYGMLYASKYNVSRKRIGGRDDTWMKEEFDLIILDALQNPFENPGMEYTFTPQDDGRLKVEVRDVKESGKVVNLLKNCFLEPAKDKTVEDVMKIVYDVLTDHLCIGARIGDLDHCQHLEELGADPHRGSNDETSWTPLQLACYYGHKDVVEWLVEEMGCDVNHETPDGMRPVFCAAERGHNDILKFLIENDAEHKLENKLEQEMHHIGVLNRHRDVVETFVGDDGLHRHHHAPRDKTPLEQMFQLGPYDGTPARLGVRFPKGHDRWPFAGVDAHLDYHAIN